MKSMHRTNRFAVCIDNEGYEASLEPGKLYRIIPDKKSAEHGFLRVVDESGEDYGFSARLFFEIDIPVALAAILDAQMNSPASTKVASRPKRKSA